MSIIQSVDNQVLKEIASFIPHFFKILYKPNNDNDVFIIERVKYRLFGFNEGVISPSLESEFTQHGQIYCTNIPDCDNCPVNKFCHHFRNESQEKLKFNNDVKFIDLFCGAGGLSIGLEKFGLSPVLALDFNEQSIQTYKLNRPFLNEEEVIVDDIIEYVDSHEIPKVSVVVGGPPCQGFSNANKQSVPDDKRNYLYKKFIDVVRLSEASLIVMENVEGILKFEKYIENDFSKIGFSVKPYILNTKDFGYPQNRKRVFWFGYKTNNIFEFEQLATIFETNIKKTLSKSKFGLMDAIGDLPKLEAKTLRNNTDVENEKWGFTITENKVKATEYSQLINSNPYPFLLNHKSKYNNDRDIEIYSRLQQGEGSDAKSIDDINPYKNRNAIFKDKFFKLRANEPSKTITAHMYYDCHMYIHPTQARGLTPREAARVQGFPDDYFFTGSPNEWYRQIGNAVSPLIARNIGQGIRAVIDFINDLK